MLPVTKALLGLGRPRNHNRVSRPALPSMPQLLAFDAAARLGSFKVAAEALHRTPSTISHDITALEQFLGQRLFERQTRRVQLTDAGARYAECVATTLNDLTDSTTRLRMRAHPDALRLSANPLTAAEIVTPLIPAFEAAFPSISLHLSVTETLENPGWGEVDFAVRYGQDIANGLEYAQICTSEAVPVAAPGVDWKTAARIDYALGASTAWALWGQDAHALPGSAERVHRFSQFAAANSAAERGTGIALGLLPLLNPLIRAGRLVTMPGAPTMPAAPISLVSRRLSREDRV